MNLKRVYILAAFVSVVFAPEFVLAGEDANTLYLSDMTDRVLLATSNGDNPPVAIGFDAAARVAGRESSPIKIGNQVYKKGIGAYNTSRIVVQLDGQYSLFKAEIGVQSGTEIAAGFLVHGDKKLLLDNTRMRDGDAAKAVEIPVVGVQELVLATRALSNGEASFPNWANAGLVRAKQCTADEPPMDMARFARVVTCDPNRIDGARASAQEEFRADDVFLESDLPPDADGVYTVPAYRNKRGCIGLLWMERRKLRELTVEFAGPMPARFAEGVQVQGWGFAGNDTAGDVKGEGPWGGHWHVLKGRMQALGDKITFHIDDPSTKVGLRKIRWLFPASSEPIRIRRLTAHTHSPSATVDLVLEFEKPLSGKVADLDMYNGEIVETEQTRLHASWDLSEPLRLKVRHTRPRLGVDDRTLLNLRLPTGAFGVCVTDVLASGCVYVKDCGVFVTTGSGGVSLAEYRKRIADRRTILDRVRAMPDQTLQQAMDHLQQNTPLPNGDPMMLSLACDNRKFVVVRNGGILFNDVPDNPDYTGGYLSYPYALSDPQFGSSTAKKLSRKLQGGWLPIPVITVEDGGLVCRQRSFVVPYNKAPQAPQGVPWLNDRPLCVSEFTLGNPLSQEADVSLRLPFIRAEGSKEPPVEARRSDRGAMVLGKGRLLAFVDTSGAAPLTAEVKDATVTLSGKLPAKGIVQCFIYIPGWEMKPEDCGTLKGGGSLAKDVESYWNRIFADSMQIEIPDEPLKNIILSSQVHCLIAARNDGQGARIAPWVGAYVYGALQSEANPIIRGMGFMGHEEFARRALDYFRTGYTPQGYLHKNGYVLMGTGWHLRTLGEIFRLTRDVKWMKQASPGVERLCRWVVRQMAKTKKLDPAGNKLPTYGLMPPSNMSDWSSYYQWFTSNSFYYAGLEQASAALAEVGNPNAGKFAKDAKEFKDDLLRAYRWMQARSPVVPLADGTWVPAQPPMLDCPGFSAELLNFYLVEYGYMTCHDQEVGSQHLIASGAMDPHCRDADWRVNYMEDAQFIEHPLRPYWDPKDWFNTGGWSKAQPYGAEYVEVLALRDDVKPFIRSFLNTIASSVDRETLAIWENPIPNCAAWDKTHETGNLLHQARTMFVSERQDELWLAPFVPNDWMKDGKVVSMRNAPTYFGKVDYRLQSSISQGYIEATIEPPVRNGYKTMVLRLRHPEGKLIRAVTVDGKDHKDLDSSKEIIRLSPPPVKTVIVKAYY